MGSSTRPVSKLLWAILFVWAAAVTDDSINQSTFINSMTERKTTIHKAMHIASRDMCLIFIFIERPYNDVESDNHVVCQPACFADTHRVFLCCCLCSCYCCGRQRWQLVRRARGLSPDGHDVVRLHSHEPRQRCVNAAPAGQLKATTGWDRLRGVERRSAAGSSYTTWSEHIRLPVGRVERGTTSQSSSTAAGRPQLTRLPDCHWIKANVHFTNRRYALSTILSTVNII